MISVPRVGGEAESVVLEGLGGSQTRISTVQSWESWGHDKGWWSIGLHRGPGSLGCGSLGFPVVGAGNGFVGV